MTFDETNLRQTAEMVNRVNSYRKGYSTEQTMADMRACAYSVQERNGYVRTGGYVLSFYQTDTGETAIKASVDSATLAHYFKEPAQ